jgi:glucose/arabinose dehydrogenase
MTLRSAAVVLLAIALARCAPVTPPSQGPAGSQATVEVIARGLDVPWALAIASDGRIFLTERPGRSD